MGLYPVASQVMAQVAGRVQEAQRVDVALRLEDKEVEVHGDGAKANDQVPSLLKHHPRQWPQVKCGNLLPASLYWRAFCIGVVARVQAMKEPNQMKIFQTYSGEHQRSYLANGVIPYDYSRNQGTEYEIFKEISQNAGAYLSGTDAWGVLSWKFEVKCHIGLQYFQEQAEKLLREGADCVFINPMIGAEAVFSNVWEQGVACGHAGIERILPFLVEHHYLKPKDLFMSSEIFAFCNFFVARENFWCRYFDYVDNVLIDLERDARLGGLAGALSEGPSHYAKNPSFTMRPFIVERLFSSFIPQSGLTVRSIKLDREVYKAKFGALLGNTLHQLSNMKNQCRSQADATRPRWEELSRHIIAGPGFFALMHLDDPDIRISDVGLATM